MLILFEIGTKDFKTPKISRYRYMGSIPKHGPTIYPYSMPMTFIKLYIQEDGVYVDFNRHIKRCGHTYGNNWIDLEFYDHHKCIIY